EQWRLERAGQPGRVVGLARVLVEGRLGVPGLQVADPAGEEDPDDAPGPGFEVWPAIGGRPGGGLLRPGHSVAMEHRPQRQAREPEPDVGQERPATDPAAGGTGPRVAVSACHARLPGGPDRFNGW